MRLFEMLKGMLFSDSSSQSSTAGANNNSNSNHVDLTNMKVVELKAMAKSRGLTGYSKLNKSQLIDLLG